MPDIHILEDYKPYPPQRAFHESPAKYRLYGGAKGGGKTRAIIAETIMRSHRYGFPVSIGIVRRTYPELNRTIIREMLTLLDLKLYRYNATNHVLTWIEGPGKGGTIDFVHLESDEDVYRYKGHQWDFLGWDELTENTEYQFVYLLGSLRSTKKGIKPKFYAGTNPTGLGAGWVKERFIDKNSKAPGYDPNEYDFIPALATDNLQLMKNDPDYVKRLEMLPEEERNALLYGSWDSLQGSFFSEFNIEKHVVKEGEIPADWKLILCLDEGRTTDPRAAHVLAVDAEAHVWVVWEYYEKGKNLKEGLEEIRERLKEAKLWDRIYKFVVPPDIKNTSTADGIGSIKIMEDMGFGFELGTPEMANRDRQDGWRTFKNYLTYRGAEEPLLKIYSCCHNLIRTIPQMVYYKSHGGKREDLDGRLEDHASDSVRYGLMSLEWRPGRFAGLADGQRGESVQIVSRSYKPRNIYDTFRSGA